MTTIAFLISAHYWWEGPAIVIAVGVFCGQLVVGWSNDLIDFEDDVKHHRVSKPLVSGLITRRQIVSALRFMTPFAFLLNLLGPLGINGGLVYMLGILLGVSYNFYFKFTVFSPLPYAIAFAALPSCIAISKGLIPPIWMWLGGALFGMAAHFVNVIKDIEQDQESGIGGLPQRLGKAGSLLAAFILALSGLAVLAITLN